MDIGKLEALINRLRNESPASGREMTLSKRVAVLAGIYGRLIYARADNTDRLDLSPAEQQALQD